MSYPAYVEMKDSGVEWIGDVPSHWEPVRFKFIAAFYGGGTPSKDNASYWKGDIPWVSPKDMKCRVIYDSEDHISEEALKDSATRLIEKGAVLIVVRSGILKHSIPVAINAVPVAMNQDMKAIVPGDRIEATYLAYLIDGCQNALLLEWRKAGATVESLEHDYIANTTLVLPSSQEQRAIIIFLNRKINEIDALVNLKERQLELLDKKRQALISHAVSRGLDSTVPMRPSGIEWLGDIPAHWTVKRLKFVSSLQTGLTLGKDYKDKETVTRPYLRVANVQDGFLDLRTITNIAIPVEEVSSYELQEGDVLMTEGGDFDKLGRGFVWEGQIEGCLHQNHIFSVRPNKDRLNSLYLSYLMTAQHGKTYFTSTSQQTTNLATTNSTKLMNFPLPLPPLDEQELILEYLNSEIRQSNELSQTVRTQINKLRDYRQSLISAAVTGKIDVRGETDDTVRGVDKKRAGRRG